MSGAGYNRLMFDELKGLVEQKLQNTDPQAVTEAAKASIGDMPPGEVSQHAQTAMTNLNDQGQTDLAKELGDLLKAAQDNPVALKNAVISFIEHHPDALAAFAPGFAKNILGKV